METAGEITLSPSITACFKVIFKSVKLTPPTSKPTAGMIRSATIEDTIFPKAPPIMIPTAMSTTLPRMANCLNSCNIFFIKQRFLYYNNKISHKLNIFNAYSEI